MSSINLRFGEKGANRVLQHRCVSYEFLDYERELDRDNLIEFFFQNTIYVIDSLCIHYNEHESEFDRQSTLDLVCGNGNRYGI